MNTLDAALTSVLKAQDGTGKPLAVVVAGHNGSGKSTLWRQALAPRLRLPLVNADRLMLSVLPEAGPEGYLPDWAARLRDNDRSWMAVAQRGVQAFVGHAIAEKVPFGMETVFSHWVRKSDGAIESKIDLIRDLRRNGYFVLLVFVGLSNVEISVFRVLTRVQTGGHNVPEDRLRHRFPRTQWAIREAATEPDALILADNSLSPNEAFRVCRVQMGSVEKFDVRQERSGVPRAITEWLDVVSPRASERS